MLNLLPDCVLATALGAARLVVANFP